VVRPVVVESAAPRLTPSPLWRNRDGRRRDPELRTAGTVEHMARKRKKRWSKLSAAELVVTAVALRDLVRRPSAEVRGRKGLWGLGLFVQPVGSPLYLIVGRRPVR
jgi:Phospholipase_D-nuclease N-terminal